MVLIFSFDLKQENRKCITFVFSDNMNMLDKQHITVHTVQPCVSPDVRPKAGDRGLQRHGQHGGRGGRGCGLLRLCGCVDL